MKVGRSCLKRREEEEVGYEKHLMHRKRVVHFNVDFEDEEKLKLGLNPEVEEHHELLMEEMEHGRGRKGTKDFDTKYPFHNKNYMDWSSVDNLSVASSTMEVMEEMSEATTHDNEEIFLRAPSEDPDLLAWQFRLAQSNPKFMQKIMSFEQRRVREGDRVYEIERMHKAKVLALAMLSGQEDMYRVMAQYVTIDEADDWISVVHPATRCTCEDNHKGSLLIRLVRVGDMNMVERALKGGLDPNTSICDGMTQRLCWKMDTYEADGPVLDATFEKSTALAAAAQVNDLRMLELLLDNGADPALNDYIAFHTAARFGHIAVLQRLFSHYRQRVEEQNDENFVHMQRACVTSLKAASATGEDTIIDWVLLRLEQMYDWDTKSVRSKRNALSMKTLARKSTFFGTNFASNNNGKSSTLPRSKSAGAGMANMANSSSPSSESSSRNLVGRILDNVLDELIREGKEPGSTVRQYVADGIERILSLQEREIPVHFNPRQLLHFYLSATDDENVDTPEDVAKQLLGIGLGQFLRGEDQESGEEKDEIELQLDEEEDEFNNRSGNSSNNGTASSSNNNNNNTNASTSRRLRSFVSKMLTGLFSLSKSNTDSWTASDKERRNAVMNAVHRGHRVVLEYLLNMCADDTVEMLVIEATWFQQKEIVVLLLDELAARKERLFAEKSHLQGDLIDRRVLTKAMKAALVIGDQELMTLLKESYGASLSEEDLLKALADVLTSNERPKPNSVAKIFELASMNEVGGFSISDLDKILTQALSVNKVNLKALKQMLTHAPLSFVTIDHLTKFVRKSCGNSLDDSWRSVFELLLRDYIRKENPDEINTKLSKLLVKAEAMPHVHVGVLTVLMNSCDTESEDSDYPETSSNRSSNSRWL